MDNQLLVVDGELGVVAPPGGTNRRDEIRSRRGFGSDFATKEWDSFEEPFGVFDENAIVGRSP